MSGSKRCLFQISLAVWQTTPKFTGLKTMILLFLTVLWVERGSSASFFNWSRLGSLISSWARNMWHGSRAQHGCEMVLVVVGCSAELSVFFPWCLLVVWDSHSMVAGCQEGMFEMCKGGSCSFFKAQSQKSHCRFHHILLAKTGHRRGKIDSTFWWVVMTRLHCKRAHGVGDNVVASCGKINHRAINKKLSKLIRG